MPPTFIDQGLVTARDPSLLKPGELSKAEDAYYKPGDPGLWVVKGRSLYNATPEAGSIVGMRHLGFDGATDQLVVHHGTVYRTGDASATGTFGDLVTGLTGGSSLESVHDANRHILANGVDRQYVVDSALATRTLGMLSNSNNLLSVADAGAGPGIELNAGSAIFYWIEERVKDGDTIIKRSGIDNPSSGEILPMFVSADSTVKPRITLNAATNSDATHWAVYASATKTGIADSATAVALGPTVFPVGAEIGEAPIGTTFIDDPRSTGEEVTRWEGSFFEQTAHVEDPDPNLPVGALYQTMAVSVAGGYLQVSRNGEPPIFSTADRLEESIVCNDVSDPSIVRFNWPEEIDKWPALNFIKFAEKEQDAVRIVKTVGQHVVVLLRDSAWRVDYLPRPEDVEFNRGRCRSRIPGAPGVVDNINAACLIALGDRYWLVYASEVGLAMTDGFTWSLLTADLDWPNFVALSARDQITVIANEAKFQVEMRYPSPGNATADKVLLAQYHPSHLKAGAGNQVHAKVTGPVVRASTAATSARIDGLQGVYSANGTRVFVEWDGTVDDDPAGSAIAFDIETGEIYPSGLGKQAVVDRIWIHHNAGAGGSTITGTLTARNESLADDTETWSVDGNVREANHDLVGSSGESFIVGAQISAPTQETKINYFQLEGDEFGDAKN